MVSPFVIFPVTFQFHVNEKLILLACNWLQIQTSYILMISRCPLICLVKASWIQGERLTAIIRVVNVIVCYIVSQQPNISYILTGTVDCLKIQIVRTSIRRQRVVIAEIQTWLIDSAALVEITECVI